MGLASCAQLVPSASFGMLALQLLLPVVSCLRASSVVQLTEGWSVCPGTVSLAAASKPSFSQHACYGAVVPATVLASMLRNGTFFPHIGDPFFDDALAKIPDIHATGKPFYTRVFRHEIFSKHVGSASGGRLILHLRGVNYFASVSPSSPRKCAIGLQVVDGC